MCSLTTNPCTQQHNYIYLLQDCFTLNVVTTLGVSELESVYSAYTVYCIIRKIPGVPASCAFESLHRGQYGWSEPYSF